LFVENVGRLLQFIKMHEKNLRISVIVPVYNREHTIRRAIDSIISQSYKPEEIIVVDDGSTDRTKEVIKDYSDALRCIFLPRNSGPSRARNVGINSARSEWIAFLDSDDEWKRDKLKNQVEYLRRYPFYQILQSEEVWIRNGVRVNPCKHHKKPVGWIWEKSLQRCLVSPSAVLVKKDLLKQYGGFDESLPVCEDYDLWLRISRHYPVGLEPSLSVVKYGGHEDQLSKRYQAMDRFRVMSLWRILKNEPRKDFRQKLIPVLEEKLKILIRGYEKRNKLNDARECREILESLADYQ
jgi:glycosyltransferase involved in cell wall biosynthesis